uniref:Interleukin-21 receptor-like n=1 Tax=Pundamilia nyererei TaxID=303518 RepID=A0A3B4G5L7_9CICH
MLMFFLASTSFCNVTCWTDYDELLNCSCAASVPMNPLNISVICRGEDEDVDGSCVIRPPQSWCQIDKPFIDVASVGTVCSTTVSEEGSSFINESSSWNLSEVVKLKPPLNVQVENAAEFYNITWSHDNAADCLRYRVRIRTSENLLKDPVFSKERVSEMQILINHNELQPHTNYTVDVQATFCPKYALQGPWSEWSSTTNWKTEALNVKGTWWHIFLPIIMAFFFCLCLCYSQKTYWQRKLQVITYIPRPDEFFKPLYHNYEGNFKEWVKPVFSEYDYLRISPNVQMMSEKQHDILHWSDENSQGNSHSTGHISIHTVTLSGEDFDEEVTSQSSLRSYQDGASLGSFEEDNREHASYALEEPHMSRMNRQSGVLPQHENRISNDLLVENLNFQPHDQFNEPERVSLDSFEQSEDGYPHVDLDTIDSGFGECGSPGASDSNTADQINSDLFHQHTNSNSNYVKQWMIM